MLTKTIKKYLTEIGRKGGQSTSEKKKASSRKNIEKINLARRQKKDENKT